MVFLEMFDLANLAVLIISHLEETNNLILNNVFINRNKKIHV